MYDLQEQEQIDALKDWWKRNGNTVMVAILVFVLAYSGMQGWRHYQGTQAANASVLFDGVEQAVKAKDAKKVIAASKQVVEQYPGSAYAPRAALYGARWATTIGDVSEAKRQLEWVIGHAKEAQLKAVARLRLAGLLADEKQYGEAVRLLDSVSEEGFAGLALDRKGDVLLTQGKPAEARAAYKSALEKVGAGNQIRQITQTKLDALGEAP